MEMLCSLLVAFASLFALACGSKSAHTMANVKANAVAAVTDQIHALAEAGIIATLSGALYCDSINSKISK